MSQKVLQIDNIRENSTNKSTIGHSKENWKSFDLGDIATFSQGIQVPVKDQLKEYKKGYTRFLRIVDYTGSNEDIRYIETPPNKYIVNKADIVMVRYGDAGFVGNGFDGAIANNLFKIIPKSDEIRSDYLYYFLKQDKIYKHLVSKRKSSALPAINFGMVSKLKILVPPFSVQQKIVEINEQFKKLEEWRAEADALADEYLKSVFLEMFGSLGTNDKNWEISNFGDVISILTDYHANGSYKVLKEHVTLYDEPNYALMVRTTDLEKNNFTNGVKYIDKSAYNFLKKSKVFGGEILINKIGSAGNVYLMPKLDRPVSLAMNQFMIRLNEKVNNIFIYYLLTSNYGETMIKNKVKGAVTKTITKDAVRNLKIPIPPIHLQNHFAETVKKVEQLKQHQKQSKQEIDNLFNTLMQKAFKGELTC